MPLFLASLCFHYQFLKENLHPTDRLHQSPIFQQITQRHCEIARVAYPWTATDETPEFTGLPPHTVILAKMNEMKQCMTVLKTDIQKIIEFELNKRDIWDGMHHACQIMDLIKNAHKDMADLIKKQQATSSVNMLHQEEEIYNRNELPTNNTLHFYNGRSHLLPRDWTMPNMTFCQLITMWLCGDKNKSVPPFRLLETIHMKNHVPRAKHILCAMRFLMKYVE